MKNFKELHPSVLIIYYLICIIVISLLNEPQLVSIACLTMIILLLSYSTLQHVLNELVFIVSLTLLIVIGFLYFYHNGITPMFYLNDLPVTVEVLKYSMFTALLVAFFLLSIQVMIHTLPSNRIIYVFTAFIPTVGVFLALCIRFIPTIKEHYKERVEVQKINGYFATKSRFDRYFATLQLLADSIFWALENTFNKWTLIKTRAFNTSRRTTFKRFSFNGSAYSQLILLLAATITLLFYWDELRFYYFPETKIIEQKSQHLVIILAMVWPLFLELKGRITWFYYKSKM
ncbi:hypothetical protein [Kurthia sibirica]|uniref:Uncharacterized protein n=1 Tax=Kurthia sibirica TaxID=202750 RepID=A0A2U3ALD9_9BACL|nr:hypothetical protein [Kurthia sibirica]PWI25343.1 hypothetical protein DEX24_08355 [Kurthia sibirica]GEK34411.1 hypothetical protein KSI01_19440 [Kurthia sibirica]